MPPALFDPVDPRRGIENSVEVVYSLKEDADRVTIEFMTADGEVIGYDSRNGNDLGAVTGNPDSDGFGGLFQGFIEASNVDPVHEITDLITAQRGYELNSKIITAADEMFAATTRIR